ncbi:MAG: chorismate lyase [Acinetobacter sp.]|nr:chorismate lyase [Acinetobacter sp.]
MTRTRPMFHHAPSIPQHLHAWLWAKGSLTQQLTQLAQGDFQVQIQQQQMQRLTREDSLWLDVPLHHTAWVREVELWGKQQAWVRAKSSFPIVSLYKKARQFKSLAQRPIGHLLFYRTQPKCQRRVIYLPEGWTRQSCYTWHGCRFIVQETFLPAFEHYLLQQPTPSK